MRRSAPSWLALSLLASTAACGGRGATASATASSAPAARSAPSGAPGVQRPYTAADVHFMTGMIAHHSQAVIMAAWAPTHGASPELAALCERILVGQRDEIATMQNWLRDHGEVAPDPFAPGAKMGMEMEMGGHLMPGMLTQDQLAQLDRSRDAEFDRLFLTFMIDHHKGALVMVNDLFASYGAAQDDAVYKLASDIYADQTIEIARMEKMLAARH